MAREGKSSLPSHFVEVVCLSSVILLNLKKIVLIAASTQGSREAPLSIFA